MTPEALVNLLGYALIALPGVVLLIRDIVRNRGGVAERKDALTAAQLAAEATAEETTKRIDELENQADAKQKDALIEVLSQLVAQGNVSQGINQQCMTLLEANQKLSTEWVRGIAERNAVQAAQTVAIEANTAAIKDIIPAEKSAVKDTMTSALKVAHTESMSDLQAWIEGLKAEARGPLEVVKGIPERLIKIDEQLAKLGGAVDVMPEKIAQPIVKELKSNAIQWSEASTKLALIADKLNDWVHKQSTEGVKP